MAKSKSRLASEFSSNLVEIPTGVSHEEIVTVATDLTTAEASLTTAITLAVPCGSVFTFPSLTIPQGYLECNGQAINRTTYADLFAIVGTTYGSGDGSTTFNIPDFRGEFLRGYDNGRGADSGRTLGSNQAHSTVEHRHDSMSIKGGGSVAWSSQTVSYGYTNNYVLTGGGGGASQPYQYTMWSGPVDTGIAGSTENRPRNVAVVYCIKY